MKILLENISIGFVEKDLKFIERGYVYIDKGIIVDYGEGLPPPELEFAEYVVEGRYLAALPGFSVGMGNIFEYLVNFIDGNRGYKDVVSTLTRDEVETLLTIILSTLALNGVTSVISKIDEVDEDLLSPLSAAICNSWLRFRVVIPIETVDINQFDDLLKVLWKSCRESDAVSKGMISVGLYISGKGFDERLLRYANEHGVTIYSEVVDVSGAGVAYVNPGRQIEGRVVIVDRFELWRAGYGLASNRSEYLNPRMFINMLRYVVGLDKEIPLVLSHYNPKNMMNGVDAVVKGGIADIVVMNFREPPAGPILMDRDTIFKNIARANYSIEAVFIGGEIVVDGGLHLMVGEKTVSKARSIVDSIKR